MFIFSLVSAQTKQCSHVPVLLTFLLQTQIINPVTRTLTHRCWILLTRELRFKITNKRAGNTFSFYPTSAHSVCFKAIAINFSIQSYKPSQRLFQCLIAVVPRVGKALMNLKWKGMPQLYTAKEDVLEWTSILCFCKRRHIFKRKSQSLQLNTPSTGPDTQQRD